MGKKTKLSTLNVSASITEQVAINEENDSANTDVEVPNKIAKATEDKLISAGTTIDQIVGINLKKKKGKREKKREKHTVLLEEQRKKSKEKEKQDIHQYLECWSTNREQWKFHKLKQIFIQDHAFDEAKINAEIWPIALEYLSGTKGSSKDILAKKAESIIREGDAAAAANADDDLQSSNKYERARELLQCLG
ncbi:uncharacterized protein C7orf50 homolog [Anopheles nili]|uniref:uncharacterized protein C7orf50 homolog n=1 Tax=Anopheles nili TaxID=185578 RepID=UPI00237A0BC6|nr:uncharacterized protein C7orf50 homolog [Anopheles nili]